MRPEILLIGDSHLSFGAGKVFKSFFSNLEQRCSPYEAWPGQAKSAAMKRFSLMGVKSTSLHNWVIAKRRHKRMVCVPDPKWPVNARLYGFSHRSDGSYVQLGKDPHLPFCRANKTPLQAVFDWAEPRLVILYFLGNTIDRWAKSQRLADGDVQALARHIPENTGCVFMTTSPVYGRQDNQNRMRAQRKIKTAFEKHGKRCSFVPMFTTATVAAIQGKAAYFRRHPNGRVKDPYHPGISAARRLLTLRQRPVCTAVMEALGPDRMATVD